MNRTKKSTKNQLGSYVGAIVHAWRRLARYGLLGGVLGLIALSLAGCGLSVSGDHASADAAPTSAAQDFNAGQSLQYSGHCDKAILLYLRALTKNHMYVNALSGLGTCYQAVGSFDAAILEYDRAISLDPTNYGLYIFRAGAEFNNGSQGAANGDLAIAMRLAPPQVPAYTAIAGAYANYADFADAVMAYDKAVALTPNSSYLYEQRANTYLQMQDTAHAYEDYGRAIKVASTAAVRATVYVDLAQVYDTQGDFDSAAKAVSTAIRLLPNTARFYVVYGNIHRDAGGYTLALRMYAQALRLVNKGVDAVSAHEGRGDTYLKLGQARTAIVEYRRALKLVAANDVGTRARLQSKIGNSQGGQS